MSEPINADQVRYFRNELVRWIEGICAKAMPVRNRTHRMALMETTAIYPTREGCYRVFGNCGATP